MALLSRLSASAITRFDTCPKQFLLADLERVPRIEQPSPVLVQANAVHHALERFYGLPLTERRPENLVRALRSVWPRHRRAGAFCSREEEARYGGEALAMLERFAGSFSLDVQPLAREQWLTGRTKSGIEVIGKLDRIDASANALTVVDYKTGHRTLEAEDLRGEPAVWVYAALTEQAYRLPVEAIRFIYLRHGAEVSWQLERDDVDLVKERLARKIGEIRAASEFEARPGLHCRFCPFALRCPERSEVSLDDLVEVEGLPF